MGVRIARRSRLEERRARALSHSLVGDPGHEPRTGRGPAARAADDSPRRSARRRDGALQTSDRHLGFPRQDHDHRDGGRDPARPRASIPRHWWAGNSSGLALGRAGRRWGDVFVAEADESDRSFLKLHPTLCLITNVDREHLDTYVGSRRTSAPRFPLSPRACPRGEPRSCAQTIQ